MDFNNSKNDLKSGIAKTYKEQEKIHDAPLINAANVPIEVMCTNADLITNVYISISKIYK